MVHTEPPGPTVHSGLLLWLSQLCDAEFSPSPSSVSSRKVGYQVSNGFWSFGLCQHCQHLREPQIRSLWNCLVYCLFGGRGDVLICPRPLCQPPLTSPATTSPCPWPRALTTRWGVIEGFSNGEMTWRNLCCDRLTLPAAEMRLWEQRQKRGDQLGGCSNNPGERWWWLGPRQWEVVGRFLGVFSKAHSGRGVQERL